MIHCPNCYIEINKNDKFCYKCGSAISKDKTIAVFQKKENNYNVKLNKISKLSIISFMLSFFLVFGSIFSIIFSILSLKEINKKNISGKVLSITALIISTLTLLFFIIFLLIYFFFKNIPFSKGGIV